MCLQTPQLAFVLVGEFKGLFNILDALIEQGWQRGVAGGQLPPSFLRFSPIFLEISPQKRSKSDDF